MSQPKFKVGDTVKFIGPRQRRLYQVIRVDDWNGDYYYDLEALSGGPRGSRPSSVAEDRIVTPGQEPAVVRDKEGRTSQEFASQVYPVGGFAKADYYYTTRETVVKVVKHTKTQIKVEAYHGGRVNERGPLNQEVYAIDTSQLRPSGEIKAYTAKYYNGEWTYYHGDKYLKPFDGQVEFLLD